MAATALRWAAKKAEATFTLDNELCVCDDTSSITLPSFYTHGDDDLVWYIKVSYQRKRPPTWHSDVDGLWLDLRLFFKSASGKKSTYVRFSYHASQTVEKTVISDLCDKYKDLLTPDLFSLERRVLFSEITGAGTHLGSIYVCNEAENIITLRISLQVSDKTLEVKNPPIKPIRAKGFLTSGVVAEKSLSDSLDALLNSGLLSDVVLCVEGQELPAHRAMLAARSPVFKGMFQSPFEENSSGKVQLKDISLGAVKQLLRFIYTGRLACGPKDEIATAQVIEDKKGDDTGDSDEEDDSGSHEEGEGDVDNVTSHEEGEGDADDVTDVKAECDGADAGYDDLVEVMVAADMYMVTELREICQERLAARLTSSPSVVTLCDVLRAGHLLDYAPLRQVGLDYLRGHRTQVLASAEWACFATTHRAVAAHALLDALTVGED